MSEIPDAVKTITDAMNGDKSEGSYYYSWQANIAMAFKDEWQRQKESAESIGCELKPFDPVIHTVANNAAKNFLDLLCRDVENDVVAK